MKNRKALITLIVVILLGICLSGKVLSDLRQMLYFSACSEHDSSYLTDFYANKRVLFIVPHEDDEYNLGSGIIEQYVAAPGSEVYITYLTNGDAFGGGEGRIRESEAAMFNLGLDANHLIFLGYGDQWDAGDYDHIYQAPGDEIIPSMCGNTRTYGTDTHPDYHTLKYGEPADYTRNNIKSDIKDVIEDINPDVIYSIECDLHQDHRATSLFFEEVMGEMLKENRDYRPRIYKGFGYCTGWESLPDYYAADNVLPVKNVFETDVMEHKSSLLFSERLRFPVAAKCLAPTELASSAYPVLSAFKGQDAVSRFNCLINSDKVFWERNPNSLLYDAAITTDADSDTACLNDFKLGDTSRIIKEEPKWNRGICNLSEGDSVCVELSQPCMMDEIVIYDSAKEDYDINKCAISFDDGEKIELNDIHPNGSASVVTFNRKNVKSFAITVLEASGDEPGLTEIEAFDSQSQTTDGFIKLACDDNFMYDYYLHKGDEVKLSVYTYPADVECSILIDDLPFSDETYIYDGKEHNIKAVSNDGMYSDEAVIKNMSSYRKMLIRLARIIEEKKK